MAISAIRDSEILAPPWESRIRVLNHLFVRTRSPASGTLLFWDPEIEAPVCSFSKTQALPLLRPKNRRLHPLWTQEPRPPDPLPSGALVPPPRFGYPRISALTQVVLPAEVQLLLVGHPLQVHSCARAGLPRVWGKTQVLTLSDRCKDHKQPRPYYDKTERN